METKKYFIFNDKLYPFDFEIFKKNSIYFNQSQAQYEKIEYIELLNEDESKNLPNISEKTIQALSPKANNFFIEIYKD